MSYSTSKPCLPYVTVLQTRSPASCPVSLSVPTSLLTFYNTFPIFLLYPPQYCLFFSAYLPSFSKAHTHFLHSLPGVTVLYHITRMPQWGKHTFFHTFPAVSFQTRSQHTTLLWSWKQPEPQLCEDKETGSTRSYTATAADLAAFQQEREQRYNVRNIMTSSWHLNCIITYRGRETEKEQR